MLYALTCWARGGTHVMDRGFELVFFFLFLGTACNKIQFIVLNASIESFYSEFMLQYTTCSPFV